MPRLGYRPVDNPSKSVYALAASRAAFADDKPVMVKPQRVKTLIDP
jgi:hypothetical protein